MSAGDAPAIAAAIIHNIASLMLTSKDYLNFKLLVSDQANVCLDVGKKLKSIYKDIKHITCITQMLHDLSNHQ